MIPSLAMGHGGPWDLLIVGIYVIPIILMIYALVDLVKRQFRDQATKIIWALVILFAPCFGSLLYLFWGKNQAVS